MEEACAVFSAKGFRDATIAEICERAEANIAAVNYHFGDKESLYNACWRHAFAVTLAAWPLDQGVDASTAPADRLRVFVRAFVRRVLSDDVIGQFPHMLVKEMAEPTAALAAIMDEVVEPQRRLLHAIIAGLLGSTPDDPRVMACGCSVISQCVIFAFNRAMRDRLLQAAGDREALAERVAEHIWRFSMAGIRDCVKWAPPTPGKGMCP